MAIRELVAYLRRRAPEVMEILDGVGYRDPDLHSAIHRPDPSTRSHRSMAEEIAHHEAMALPAQVDPGLEALALPVSVHPARGSAEAMGEAWAAQALDDDAWQGERCGTCDAPALGMPCTCCTGCVECCMCHSAGLLDVGMI